MQRLKAWAQQLKAELVALLNSEVAAIERSRRNGRERPVIGNGITAIPVVYHFDEF